MPNSIVIFSKAPILGKVKTRLTLDPSEKAISKKMAFEIHTAFLRDTLIKVASLQKTQKYIYFDSPNISNSIQKTIKNFRISLGLQKGKNLGEKMETLFCDLLKTKKDKVVIIGTDSPTLPAHIIEKSFCLLDENDVVLGPAQDGGYYLIGLRGHPYPIFQDIEWGTSAVALKTLRLIKKNKLMLGILPAWYDIDTPDDLHFLKNHIELLTFAKEDFPQNTYQCLKKL